MLYGLVLVIELLYAFLLSHAALSLSLAKPLDTELLLGHNPTFAKAALFIATPATHYYSYQLLRLAKHDDPIAFVMIVGLLCLLPPVIASLWAAAAYRRSQKNKWLFMLLAENVICLVLAAIALYVTPVYA